MTTAPKKCQVDISTNPQTIIVTEEPIATNIPQTYAVRHIEVITPLFFDYSHPQTVAIVATLAGPNRITIPGNFAQEVTAGDIYTISGDVTNPSNNGSRAAISAANSGANTIVTVGGSTLIAAGANSNVSFTTGHVEQNASGDNFRETYPYPRMTRLLIVSTGQKTLDLELQSITNQATWSLGTKESLRTAEIAINALIV